VTHDNAITVEGLKKSFKNIPVLDGIGFSVERGTMLALLGPNGAGKTTTVRILSTLLPYDAGIVRVNGYDVKHDGHRVRESIGLTGQFAAVDEYLNGMENLVMMGRLYHLGKKESERRAKELLEQFDLSEAAFRKVKTYSGGMRRKLDLALSLIGSPPVIFLDEPTTGLDPRSRIAMWDVIKRLVESDVTILLTTQYLEEADLLADKIAVLHDGKIIAHGTADELKAMVGKERLDLTVRRDGEKTDQSIPVENGVADIRRILSDMEKEGAEIESLSLHKPTLDDVFLHFTGHKAEEEHGEQQDAKK
jgi:ABC-2 type transport system ATP-binding protein